MIEGLSHVTFVVADLDRMTKIMTDLLGAELVYDSGNETFSTSRERFFDLAGIWIAVMEGDALPTRTYNHVAFKIRDHDIDAYADRAAGLGLEIRPGRSRVPGEGRSLYFYDHDNHLFELHTGTREERLARYAQTRTSAP
jgi:fosfomycin resistance protein FosX